MKSIQEWKAIYSADDSVPFYDNDYLIKIIQQDARAAGFAEGLEMGWEQAAKIVERHECEKNRLCCKLHLANAAIEIRALLKAGKK